MTFEKRTVFVEVFPSSIGGTAEMSHELDAIINDRRKDYGRGEYTEPLEVDLAVYVKECHKYIEQLEKLVSGDVLAQELKRCHARALEIKQIVEDTGIIQSGDGLQIKDQTYKPCDYGENCYFYDSVSCWGQVVARKVHEANSGDGEYRLIYECKGHFGVYGGGGDYKEPPKEDKV